jgi:hypothetical protein
MRRHGVEVRGLKVQAPVTVQGLIPDIIRKYEEDVGTMSGRISGGDHQ